MARIFHPLDTLSRLCSANSVAHALSEDFHCEESHEPDLARGLPEHFAMCIYVVSVFSTQLCGHLCEDVFLLAKPSVPHTAPTETPVS